MLKKILSLAVLSSCLALNVSAQFENRNNKQIWVDSVFNSLNDDQRIAQLIVVRAHSNLKQDHVEKVANEIKKYNIGALCFFQGGPVRQANLTNYYQSIAQTPIMVTIDGEWGLGMRLDSAEKFPYQLTLGALASDELVYKMGVAVGEQCKRIGVHVNYAPVVDVNNNPNNPVIGYRSFGESVEKVSAYGAAYTRGMQDAGIMACAKHFPGHGDVDVDSHYDLPVINKTVEQLKETELPPFKALFDAGVGSVMVAHLSIPSIDNRENRATTLSKNNVTGLLKNEMGYKGLIFTDALEMKGVAKFFPGGTIAVEALVAGNDMLCLPEDVAKTIEAVKAAIQEGKLNWASIHERTRKVLAAKYDLGLDNMKPIDTKNLVQDINAKTRAINDEVARKVITLVAQASSKSKNASLVEIPFTKIRSKVAFVGLGLDSLSAFGAKIKNHYRADTYFFNYKKDKAAADKLVKEIKAKGYDAIIMGVHNYSLRPANNFGFSEASLQVYQALNSDKTITVSFGNVLANKNFCDAYTLVAAYQDDISYQNAAFEVVSGKIKAEGTFPVGFCNYKTGDGLAYQSQFNTKKASYFLNQVDSVLVDAIDKGAFPGCVVMAVHNGEVIYQKAFGNYDYTSGKPVTTNSIFDLASVTKISATTVSVMKLYEEGKIDLKKTLGDYLPELKGTDKAKIKVEDALLHRSGLVPFIAFYKETLDDKGNPLSSLYSKTLKKGFEIPVAANLYLRNDWADTINKRIIQSKLGPNGKYVYSDNNFIYLGKIVAQVSGKPLNEYVQETFYKPLGMYTTGFKPFERFNVTDIIPTEKEDHFRQQTLQGYVHDEGASLFGGVAGHAGLFSNASDLSVLYQMLLNGGVWNGTRFLKEETIDLFTRYNDKVSRRGYGFDKPELDNDTNKDPYPSANSSAFTFGHTGFTGTAVWVDPAKNLVYVFLSNRVNPTRSNGKLSSLSVRRNVLDLFYQAIDYTKLLRDMNEKTK